MRDAPVIRASLSTLPGQTVKTTHQFCCRTLVSRIPAKPPSHAAHGILAVPLNWFVLSLLQFSRRIHVSGPCSCPLPPFIMLYCLVCISFLSFSVFLASRDIPLTFFKRGGGQHAVYAFCFTPSSCLGLAFFFFAITHIRSVSKKTWET